MSNQPVSKEGAGGKKKGKMKGVTVNINDFLQDVPRVDWAKTMEEEEQASSLPHSQSTTTTIEVKTKIIQTRSQLPSAPKSSRGPLADLENVPQNPPFIAKIWNVSYQAKEDDVHDFFERNRLKVKFVKMRQKGSGTVEFYERQDLIEAINLAGEKIMDRDIRIDVCDENNRENGQRDRGYGSGYNRQSERERADSGAERNDWRQGAAPFQPAPHPPPVAPLPPPPAHSPPAQPVYQRPTSKYEDYNRGSYSDYEQGYGTQHRQQQQHYPQQPQYHQQQNYYRGGGGGGYGGDRDRTYPMQRSSSYQYDMRQQVGRNDNRGYQDRGGYDRRYSRDYPQDYNYGGGYGGDRSGGNNYAYGGGGGGQNYYNTMPSRPAHSNYSNYPSTDVRGTPDGAGYAESGYRSERGASNRGSYGTENRGRYRTESQRTNDSISEDPREREGGHGNISTRQSEYEDTGSEPKERKKLELKPRTKPIQEEEAQRPSAVFGAAKPVDTATKERLIEERLAKEREELHKNVLEKTSLSKEMPLRVETRRRTSERTLSQSSGGNFPTQKSPKSPPVPSSGEVTLAPNAGQMKILQRTRSSTSQSSVGHGGTEGGEGGGRGEADGGKSEGSGENAWVKRSIDTEERRRKLRESNEAQESGVQEEIQMDNSHDKGKNHRYEGGQRGVRGEYRGGRGGRGMRGGGGGGGRGGNTGGDGRTFYPRSGGRGGGEGEGRGVPAPRFNRGRGWGAEGALPPRMRNQPQSAPRLESGGDKELPKLDEKAAPDFQNANPFSLLEGTEE